MAETNNGRPNVVVPNPDPSDMTSHAIDRAIYNSETKIKARLDGMEKAVEVYHSDLTRVPTTVDRAVLGLRELIETRIQCIENDVEGVHFYLDTRGEDIAKQIMHLRELVTSKIESVSVTISKLDAVSEERFTRIDTQFIERDKRTDQLSLADKTAVAAALQAAKEAVGAQNTSNSIAIAKSESSTVESIKQLQTLFNSAIDGLNDKVNDVKSRLDRGEGGSKAIDRTTDRTSTVVGQVIACAVAFVVIMSAIVGLVAFVVTRAPPSPTWLPSQNNAAPR